MEISPLAGLNCYTWRIGPSIFRALPEQGARLMSWDIKVAGSERNVIYWPDGEEDWSQLGTIRGGNPILFPFVARTYDKGQLGFWKAPHGERLPMNMHGYARQGRFVVLEAAEDGFDAQFEPDEACRMAYPFDYRFVVRYRFTELSLSITLELTNLGSTSLPWCAGHHFYFRLPWHAGSVRGDYRLQIPAKKAFYHTGDGALQPTSFEEETAFDEPSLSERIHTRLRSRELRFGPRSGEEDIVMRVGEQPVPSQWNAVVTWTQGDDSPFYCVEPWMGPPNSPEHRKGYHLVEPGQQESFFTEVCLA